MLFEYKNKHGKKTRIRAATPYRAARKILGSPVHLVKADVGRNEMWFETDAQTGKPIDSCMLKEIKRPLVEGDHTLYYVILLILAILCGAGIGMASYLWFNKPL